MNSPGGCGLPPSRPGRPVQLGAVQLLQLLTCIEPSPCSAKRATVGLVPSVPPVSLRLGREGLRALDEIARWRGVSRAEAARQAIAETAERERRRRGLAAEAAALAKDAAYVREAREVSARMAQLRGPA